jgi:hypothetical protein
VAVDRAPAPEELGAVGLARLVLLTFGGGALVDGAMMAWVGPGALLGAPYQWPGLAGALVVAGLAALVAALLPSPRAAGRTVERATPHLLPYAAPALNAGVFLLWVFSVVAVYQGCLDIFAGAHAGGAGTGVADPLRLQVLIAVASGVFVLVPLYLAATLRWLIPMGRWIDSSDGRDPYGSPVTPPTSALVEAALRGPARSSAPHDRRAGVAVVTLLAAAGVSIGIQLVEVGTAPISPGLWFESQAVLPVYAMALALGVLAVDGSVRGLEERFTARIRPVAPVPGTAAGPGAVQ